jgi:hypothetical protein
MNLYLFDCLELKKENIPAYNTFDLSLFLKINIIYKILLP